MSFKETGFVTYDELFLTKSDKRLFLVTGTEKTGWYVEDYQLVWPFFTYCYFATWITDVFQDQTHSRPRQNWSSGLSNASSNLNAFKKSQRHVPVASQRIFPSSVLFEFSFRFSKQVDFVWSISDRTSNFNNRAVQNQAIA